MGSRPVVQQQNRGEAVVGDVKPQNVAAGGRNRRALGDIGNMVNVAPVENNKKPVQNKVTKKPKPVTVIEISSDTEKQPNKRIQVKPEAVIEISPDTNDTNEVTNKKILRKEGLSRKKPQSLTSILTARSKVACGLANKPKELIVDIDACDVENELAVVEYVEDIYKFYKLAENESRVFDYMDSQPEISEKMRAILIDWIVEVHKKFELVTETLYLAINIVDRYLATKVVKRKELQLVGIGAMLIASKYEEIWAPEVNDFVCISDKAYSHQQMLVMEKCILGELQWNLTVPTPYVFLVRFIKASVPPDPDMENLVFFLAELGTMNYANVIYCPSMVAASAVYAARRTLNKTPVWTDTLKLHTGFSEPQLMDCAKLLVSFHSMASDNKLKVIYRKYSNPQRGCVALLTPAKNFLASA